MKRFWVFCPVCNDAWVESFLAEHGLLVAEYNDHCPDCGCEYEIQDEYEPGDDREYERETPLDF